MKRYKIEEIFVNGIEDVKGFVEEFSGYSVLDLYNLMVQETHIISSKRERKNKFQFI